MATWVTHWRIADYFLKRYDFLHEYEFSAGSVAPDCGYGKKDSYGDFTPPPSVTHWTSTGNKRNCRYKQFCGEYLKNRKRDSAYSFYLGYYVHLLTDIIWSGMVYMPTHKKYAKQYRENPEFLRVIKHDWNDLDYKYLSENPNLKPYRLVEEHKGEVNDYLPYYEHNQLTNQIRYNADYYKNEIPCRDINREYKYMTEKELSETIWLISEIINSDLIKKELV